MVNRTEVDQFMDERVVYKEGFLKFGPLNEIACY